MTDDVKTEPMITDHPTRAGHVGAAVLVATFIADQASKIGLLFGLDILNNGPFRILPFFDLTVVWNRGVSYGLFQQDSDLGRWGLIGFSILASVVMGWMMWHARDRIAGVGLGLVVGGALGNAVDRIAYGAVFDFAHLHFGRFSWYVFNVADAAIVVGVGCLLYEALFMRARPAKAAPGADGSGHA